MASLITSLIVTARSMTAQPRTSDIEMQTSPTANNASKLDNQTSDTPPEIPEEVIASPSNDFNRDFLLPSPPTTARISNTIGHDQSNFFSNYNDIPSSDCHLQVPATPRIPGSAGSYKSGQSSVGSLTTSPKPNALRAFRSETTLFDPDAITPVLSSHMFSPVDCGNPNCSQHSKPNSYKSASRSNKTSEKDDQAQDQPYIPRCPQHLRLPRDSWGRVVDRTGPPVLLGNRREKENREPKPVYEPWPEPGSNPCIWRAMWLSSLVFDLVLVALIVWGLSGNGKDHKVGW